MAKIEFRYRIGLASAALVTVLATSAMLVFGESDEELAEQREHLKTVLAALRETAAEERAALAWEQAERAVREALQKERGAEDFGQEQRITRELNPTRKRCPYCQEEILYRAVKCKHCGEFLDEEVRTDRRPASSQRWNPGVAAVLSFLFPGLGQIYKGQVLSGFVWVFGVAMGYVACLLPGVIAHVICVFDAASGKE